MIFYFKINVIQAERENNREIYTLTTVITTVIIQYYIILQITTVIINFYMQKVYRPYFAEVYRE